MKLVVFFENETIVYENDWKKKQKNDRFQNRLTTLGESHKTVEQEDNF